MKDHEENAVRIAEFKAHLSAHLRQVRRGHPLTLLDRETPIARVLPYPGSSGRLRIRKPIRKIGSIAFPPPVKGRVDSLRLLIEERRRDR